jgi:hypothetical protein
MNNITKDRICTAIEKREDFINTLNQRDDDEMFLHTHNVFKLFDKWIVYSDYTDSMSSERTFLIWDDVNHTLRECEGDEDEILREWDNENPLLELKDDLHFICNREKDNTISRWSDDLETMNDSDDVMQMMEFRGQHWDLWTEYCLEQGINPEVGK